MASYFEVYKKWLQNRTHSIGPIEMAVEAGLRSVPILLPGHSYDLVTLGEASTAIVALWKTLNDSILEPGKPMQRWLTVLEVVGHLVEMAAIHGEQKQGMSRYNTLVAYESSRAALQLLILYRQGGRLTVKYSTAGPNYNTLAVKQAQRFLQALETYRTQLQNAALQTLSGQQPQDQLSATAQNTAANQQAMVSGGVLAGPSDEPDQQRSSLWWRLSHVSRRDPTQAATSSSNGSRSSPAHDTQAANRKAERDAGAKATKLQSLALSCVVAGELLYIIRLPIYALALRSKGRSSMKPWLLSLAMDLASASMISGGARLSQRAAVHAALDPALQQGSVASLHRMQTIVWAPDEVGEQRRRNQQLFYYLIRDPVFRRIILPKLNAIIASGVYGSSILTYIIYWQEFFTWQNTN